MIKTILKPILFILFLMNSFGSLAQSKNAADSAKTKDSTINVLSSKVDEILQRLKDAKEGEKQHTGIMRFDTLLQVPIYTANRKRTNRNMLIDKVVMLIQDGYVVDLQVFSGNRVFTNTDAPITIEGKRWSQTTRYIDFLQNKRNAEEFIKLQESVFYDPLNTFFPEDGLITLTRQRPVDTLAKNVGVNTVLDLRLYTDALASLGNEPNGIFLTDIRLKQFLHRKHYINSGTKTFQYLKINFSAAKFDSKYGYVAAGDTINRTELLQKTKVSAEVAVNLYTNWLGNKSLNNYYLDFGGGFGNVNFTQGTDTTTIKIQNLFTEAGINLKNSSNIGFDFYVRGIVQYSPQTDFNDQDKPVKFLRLGGEVFWNPFNDAPSRIFGRINYTIGLDKPEKKNSFSQIQIGYSTLLSKAIGRK